jgi:hypothetical protein
LIGIIDCWGIDGIEISGVIATTATGIEIKCGMIGHGVLHLIDGRHLDMIAGDIIAGWVMHIGVMAGVGITIMAGMAGMIILGAGDSK